MLQRVRKVRQGSGLTSPDLRKKYVFMGTEAFLKIRGEIVEP